MLSHSAFSYNKIIHCHFDRPPGSASQIGPLRSCVPFSGLDVLCQSGVLSCISAAQFCIKSSPDHMHFLVTLMSLTTSDAAVKRVVLYTRVCLVLVSIMFSFVHPVVQQFRCVHARKPAIDNQPAAKVQHTAASLSRLSPPICPQRHTCSMHASGSTTQQPF